MKEIYLKHYWMLFREFIETFKELSYNNIPLPILTNFYQYTDAANLRAEMEKQTFVENLKQSNFDNAEIQPYFESCLDPIKVPLKKLEGLTLLNFNYLRFPPEIFQEHFDPKHSVILMNSKPKTGTYQEIPVDTLTDYKDDEISGTELISKAKNLFKENSDHILFRNESFQNKFINQIPIMVNLLATVENYLSKVPISCVIVGTTEDLISRILSIVSSSKGIPSICMQHGIIMGEEAFLPVFTTKVAVYGSYEKQWYKSRGVAENKIDIIGHPRYDLIFKETHMAKTEFQQEYDLSPEKKYVLVATQPGNQEHWTKLINGLAKNPDLEIIIKPHPWEIGKKRYTCYEELTEKYDSVKLISSRKVNVYDILPNVDLVIVRSSTVGMEAMLFHKPVLVMKDNMYQYYDQLKNFSIANIERLIELVNQYFQNKTLQTELEEKRKEFILNSYPQKLSGNKFMKLVTQLSQTKLDR